MGGSLTRAGVGIVLLTAVLAAAPPPEQLYSLSPKASDMWAEYLKVTKYRIDNELKSPNGFLALDFAKDGAGDRAAVLKGELPIAEMTTRWENGTEVIVPSHWVHHWRGAVLLPGFKLDRVFDRMEKEIPGVGTPEVPKGTILSGAGSPTLRTSMRVQRQGSVLGWSYHYVYNTEFDVAFERRSPTRGTSATVATKIAELHHPGEADEREAKPKEDSQYLLRWNSYWRYEEVSSGVIVECESLTLSQDPGMVLTALGAGRIARAAAQDAMMHALVNLRTFFQTRPSSSPAR